MEAIQRPFARPVKASDGLTEFTTDANGLTWHRGVFLYKRKKHETKWCRSEEDARLERARRKDLAVQQHHTKQEQQLLQSGSTGVSGNGIQASLGRLPPHHATRISPKYAPDDRPGAAERQTQTTAGQDAGSKVGIGSNAPLAGHLGNNRSPGPPQQYQHPQQLQDGTAQAGSPGMAMYGTGLPSLGPVTNTDAALVQAGAPCNIVWLTGMQNQPAPCMFEPPAKRQATAGAVMPPALGVGYHHGAVATSAGMHHDRTQPSQVPELDSSYLFGLAMRATAGQHHHLQQPIVSQGGPGPAGFSMHSVHNVHPQHGQHLQLQPAQHDAPTGASGHGSSAAHWQACSKRQQLAVGYSAAACVVHQRAPAAGMQQPATVIPSGTQLLQQGHSNGWQPGGSCQQIQQQSPQQPHTWHQLTEMDVLDVDDEDLQGGLYLYHGNSAAGVGDVNTAAGTVVPAAHALQGLATAEGISSLHLSSRVSPIRMSNVHLQPQASGQQQQQQLAQQPGSQRQGLSIRSLETTQHQQQPVSAVDRVLEALTQRGYQHAAAGANPVIPQQAAGARAQSQPTDAPAASAVVAAQATHSQAPKPNSPHTTTFWDAVITAAAVATAAAAGASDLPPATAALLWLRQAAALALRVLTQQQTHVPAVADDIAGKEQDQQQEVDAAVHALRAAFNAVGYVDAFSSLLQRVVPCEVENPELAGKHTVLLGARAQGASAQVHVGLAATQQQLAAAVQVLVSYVRAISAAIDSVISIVADISAGEQHLLQCADMLADAAQKVVRALPNAVLVAAKVFRADGDWQSAYATEYETLKVLSRDADCKHLVTELLGSGCVVGPVRSQQQHHNSSDTTAAAAAANTAKATVLIMQYLPQTLDEVLQLSGPLTEQHTKRVMQRLFKLLTRCHSGCLKDVSGVPVVVVHRDLKAANVLLDKDGNCRVGDWGAATMLRLSAADQSGSAAAAHNGLFAPLAQMYTLVGTPLWMPGDVVGSGPVAKAGYDSSADCHAAAIIGVEIMSGGWNKLLAGLAAGACMAQGGLAANYSLYLQQLKRLAAGKMRFPHEQQVVAGLGSFRDLLARACGLGCQRHAASFLLQHPWLVSD